MLEMATKTRNSNQKYHDNIKQVNLMQIFVYVFFIITIWVVPLATSIFLLIVYYLKVIQTDIAIYTNPIEILRQVQIGNPQYLIISMISPALIILLYLIDLIFVAILAKLCIFYCNHKSKTRELVGAKGVQGSEKRDVDFYHLRGAIFRIMKWIYSRSPFPWLIKWAFAFVGNNHYGKGTVLEDQFYCHEYLETGDNVHIDKLSIVSSHLVDGRYGALTLKKVKIGDNSIIGPKVGICPGVQIGNNSEIFCNSFIPKFKKLESNANYHGIPTIKVDSKTFIEISNKNKGNYEEDTQLEPFNTISQSHSLPELHNRRK